MILMTLDCIRLMKFIVIQIIYRNVGLKCFFSFTEMFVIIIIHSYFSYISQGNVVTHL